MDALNYLSEIVEPTIRDFEQFPTSRRHAFLACVVTFHSVDYISHPDKSQNLRETFRKECEAFSIVDRVAHAMKHVETGHPHSPSNQPLTVDDVIERPPAIYGTGVYDRSRYDDPVGGVEITLQATDDLLDVVKSAAQYLKSKC